MSQCSDHARSTALTPRANSLLHFLAVSSLERDFCRQRQTRQKGPQDEISAQRSEIRHHHTREMAAKAAFLLASCQLRVSEDWVVADAVRGEPVSEPKFPVSALNRDFFGEDYRLLSPNNAGG